MNLDEIIENYKDGNKVTKEDLSALTSEDKEKFISNLLTDEELFLKAMPECCDDQYISDALSREKEELVKMILNNFEIFKRLISTQHRLDSICKEFPERKVDLIAKYSLLNETIEETVERIVEEDSLITLDDDPEFFNKKAAERCSLLSALNQKLNETCQQVPKTKEGKEKLRMLRDKILNFEKSLPILIDNQNWEREKTKFLDFFNWRYSNLVNSAVSFLKENYAPNTLNGLIENIPYDLRLKMAAPNVSETFKSKINRIN